MKAIILLCLIAGLALVYADFPPVPADGRCVPGETYSDDCNTCQCTPQGTIGGCTYKFCVHRKKRETDFPPVPADGRCVPGETYSDDCNTCRCTPQGTIGGCTYKLCLHRKKRETECTDGDFKKVNCNQCHCSKGKWACTKLGCL